MCIANKGKCYYGNNPQYSPKNKELQTRNIVCDKKGLLFSGWLTSNIFSQGPSSSQLFTALVVNSLALSGGCSTNSATAVAKVGTHILMGAEHPTFIHLEKSPDVRFKSSSGEDWTYGNVERSVSSCTLCQKGSTEAERERKREGEIKYV